ncbi:MULTISPECIES: ribonuclease activity regulator RraA [unclassified Variovorax]|jgi:regulator of RNase E activity RraA|uniref:ribonuclease activity regulator RraA n=1 Tax=unclassified Variovorax TaxID=663243 RepID=UPI00086A8DB0|nr:MULTISPECIES: ribonuclease activity regulator RraA [unclassified Variovorax]MBN8755588.1 ribonuclease activity regulator RraA [Variovorax sp.]ODU19149.1 MAG: dimethylmenaquinone methyltransferase [Variovorax sp. SCN 67-85]ODV23417.1 MAG: dimethylmenaquinone methyltransferase [Variovorax sp. SCN 67-20]OJZ16052.1 MAG: dimethylmenaquinone methyltransferase [Variovorax sp. 67-131]
MNEQKTLSAAARAKLAQVGSANVANALLKRGFRNVYLLGLSPLSPDQPQLVGPAYTLRFMPAREDIDTMANYGRTDNLHRRAVEECPVDHVLVIDTGGCLRSAAAGDLMAARMRQRGVAGVVTDGGYRDTPAIRKTGLPAYQRQSAPPATPIAMHPVELNGPVGCAGVAIYPGDVLVGDGEGVVVIPQHLVEEVAAEALDAVEYEAFAELQIARGRSIFGLFPATPESRKEYEGWVAAGRPSGAHPHDQPA